MNRFTTAAALGLVALALAGCHASHRGVLAGRHGPDEFAVARRAPLVIPPDFALVPPKPGAPRPQEADSSTQALNALFGGQRAAPSGGEQAVLDAAGRPEPGIRSNVDQTGTTTVDKGSTTRDILNAPASQNPQANATTPQ